MNVVDIMTLEEINALSEGDDGSRCHLVLRREVFLLPAVFRSFSVKTCTYVQSLSCPFALDHTCLCAHKYTRPLARCSDHQGLDTHYEATVVRTVPFSAIPADSVGSTYRIVQPSSLPLHSSAPDSKQLAYYVSEPQPISPVPFSPHFVLTQIDCKVLFSRHGGSGEKTLVKSRMLGCWPNFISFALQRISDAARYRVLLELVLHPLYTCLRSLSRFSQGSAKMYWN
jgi:hypothetical protein